MPKKDKNNTLIILDYRNGVVTIMPVDYGIDRERQVEVWCEKNSTSPNDCYWMAWNGQIQ